MSNIKNSDGLDFTHTLFSSNIAIIDEEGNFNSVVDQSQIEPFVPTIVSDMNSDLNDLTNSIEKVAKIRDIVQDHTTISNDNEQEFMNVVQLQEIPDIILQAPSDDIYSDIPEITVPSERITISDILDVQSDTNNQFLTKNYYGQVQFADVNMYQINGISGNIDGDKQHFLVKESDSVYKWDTITQPAQPTINDIAGIDRTSNDGGKYLYQDPQGNIKYSDIKDSVFTKSEENIDNHYKPDDVTFFVSSTEKIYLFDIIRRMSGGFLGNNMSNIRINNGASADVTLVAVADNQNILHFPDDGDILIYFGKDLTTGEPGYWRNFNIERYTNILVTGKGSTLGSILWSSLGHNIDPESDISDSNPLYNDASTLSDLMNKLVGKTITNFMNLGVEVLVPTDGSIIGSQIVKFENLNGLSQELSSGASRRISRNFKNLQKLLIL